MKKIIENMKKYKKKWLIIGIPSLIIVAMIISSIASAKKITYAEEKVEKRDISTYYTATGNIDAKDKQDITTAMVTKIDKVYVTDGQIVKKGTVLYSLDASDMNGSIEQAKIQANNAKKSYDSAKRNTKTALKKYNDTLKEIRQAKGAGMDTTALEARSATERTAHASAKSMEEQAKGQYALAKAGYNSALQQKSNLKIKSTIAGQVSDLVAKSGQSYAPGTALLSVINYDALKLEIKVDEYQIAKLDYGKVCDVTINSLNKTLKGKVYRISSQAKTVNDVSYFEVALKIPYKSDIKVGMSAEVKIPKEEAKDVLSIKTESLQFDGDMPYVFIKNASGKYDKKFIETGVNQGEFIEIKSGLELGEMIYIPMKRDTAMRARMQNNRQMGNDLENTMDGRRKVVEDNNGEQ